MSLPAFGICGWSGAGKTRLIEQVLPRLTARGLTVAVVKHDAHGLEVDHRGRDTDRFFRAGAAHVYACDAEQSFKRSRNHTDLEEVLSTHPPDVDLILFEGWKKTPIPRIWLHHPHRPERVDFDNHVLAALNAGSDRLEQAEALIVDWLAKQWRSREQWIGILVGGKSNRMGRPKAMLPWRGRTLVETTFVQASQVCPHIAFLGDGPLPDDLSAIRPRLPDVSHLKGPLAGILAAMRWNPSASWTFLACDMPDMNTEFLGWLQGQRRPGVWAILPKTPDTERLEPLAAVYEPQMLRRFEELARTRRHALHPIARCGKVLPANPPPHLVRCLLNVNTPNECPPRGTAPLPACT